GGETPPPGVRAARRGRSFPSGAGGRGFTGSGPAASRSWTDCSWAVTMADVMTTPWGDGWLVRPSARSWRCPSPSTAARAFHASLPGYAVTALVEVPALAGRWGVGAGLGKNGASRRVLSGFK